MHSMLYTPTLKQTTILVGAIGGRASALDMFGSNGARGAAECSCLQISHKMRSNVDLWDDREIVGWMADETDLNKPVAIEIVADGRVARTVTADLLRHRRA